MATFRLAGLGVPDPVPGLFCTTCLGSSLFFLPIYMAERVTAVGQSFFDPLPAGADLYLLKNVLGDWLDREAMAILRRCAEAARPQVASPSSAGYRPTRTAVRRRPC